MTQSNIQRVRAWRLRYFLATQKQPDTLSHLKQIRYGLRFPLQGRWPSDAEITRDQRKNFTIIKFPHRRNRPSSYSSGFESA